MKFKFNAIIDFDDNIDTKEIEDFMDNIIAYLWNNSKGVNITDYGQPWKFRKIKKIQKI